MQSDIKTYSMFFSSNDLCRSINNLVKENLASGTIPYLNKEPLPQDMNVINGRHLGDLNKIQLELKAAKIGATSLKWIFGADAALLGLELKEPSPSGVRSREGDRFDNEPVVVFANTQRALSSSVLKTANQSNIAREGLEMDAQCVYLVDQFTDKSLQRAMKPQYIEERINMYGTKEAKKQINVLAKNFLTYTNEYDTGLKEADRRKSMRQNVVRNLNSKNRDGTPNKIYSDVSKTHNNIFSKYNDEQKLLFNVLNSYYTKQSTGLEMTTNYDSQKSLKDDFYEALSSMSNIASPRLATTLAEAVLFTDRTSHLDFSYEAIYSEKDASERDKVLAPEASRFKTEEIAPERIVDNKEREILRARSHEYKPRLIGR